MQPVLSADWTFLVLNFRKPGQQSPGLWSLLFSQVLTCSPVGLEKEVGGAFSRDEVDRGREEPRSSKAHGSVSVTGVDCGLRVGRRRSET